MDALINKIKELRQVEPLQTNREKWSTEMQNLENEIERFKQIAVDFNVDTSKAQKEHTGRRLKRFFRTTKLKSTQEPVKINLPITVNPIPEQEGFSIFPQLKTIYQTLTTQKELLNKALKDILETKEVRRRAEFLSSLNTGFQAYSSILQESLGLQIEANNELIKQREISAKILKTNWIMNLNYKRGACK